MPRWAIAATARWGYNEPYQSVPMRHHIERGDGSDSIDVEYQWKLANRWNRIAAKGIGASQPLHSGSHEQFIAEHYWGYTPQRDGSTLEYQVRHVPWNTWSATEVEIDFDGTKQYGDAFSETFSRPPESAFIADGSPVTVSRPRRIR